jgi:hypothetical protein
MMNEGEGIEWGNGNKCIKLQQQQHIDTYYTIVYMQSRTIQFTLLQTTRRLLVVRIGEFPACLRTTELIEWRVEK